MSGTIDLASLRVARSSRLSALQALILSSFGSGGSVVIPKGQLPGLVDAFAGAALEDAENPPVNAEAYSSVLIRVAASAPDEGGAITYKVEKGTKLVFFGAGQTELGTICGLTGKALNAADTNIRKANESPFGDFTIHTLAISERAYYPNERDPEFIAALLAHCSLRFNTKGDPTQGDLIGVPNEFPGLTGVMGAGLNAVAVDRPQFALGGGAGLGHRRTLTKPILWRKQGTEGSRLAIILEVEDDVEYVVTPGAGVTPAPYLSLCLQLYALGNASPEANPNQA